MDIGNQRQLEVLAEEEAWRNDRYFPIVMLRRPLTVNLFKHELLLKDHVPGEPQTYEVLRRFSDRYMYDRIDPRSWESWFRPGVAPKKMSAEELDRYMDAERDPRRYELHPDATPATSFYSDLLRRSLVADLLERCNSKQAAAVLAQRAATFTFCSPWHAHAGAVEAVALSDGNGDVGWETLRVLAGRRIQAYVHARWNPRRGTVFAELPSRLAAVWATASEQERQELKSQHDRLGVGLFDRQMSQEWRPDWGHVVVEPDVSPSDVHRMMFAIATDGEFLSGERLDTWVLDMVTASLAMHAVAWTDRYSTHGVKGGPEVTFWRAIEEGFLVAAPVDRQLEAFAEAADEVGLDPTEANLERLVAAGVRYRELLHQVGLSGRAIADLAAHARARHPVSYSGARRRLFRPDKSRDDLAG